MAKSEELPRPHEPLAIPASALTEFLIGAFHQGGRRLAQAVELVAQLEVLDVNAATAIDAARLGGECLRRGAGVGALDLLVAATARHHRAAVLSRDRDFARVPGVARETNLGRSRCEPPGGAAPARTRFRDAREVTDVPVDWIGAAVAPGRVDRSYA